jgi:hydroxymethylbilane synthase
MRKVADGELDAVMLAVVGLMRLGFAVGDHEALDVRDCPPAPGQGALAVQVRADDVKLREHVARTLDDPQTRRAVTAERALLALLGASCDIPLGALARVEGGGDVLLYAALATESGIRRTTARARDPQAAAERAAEALEVAVGA